jgi:heme exporter protein D
MHFESFSAFIEMGGYAKYVWPSFLITWLCFVVLVMHSRKENRALLKFILNESARKKRIEEKRKLDNELKGKNTHESET